MPYEFSQAGLTLQDEVKRFMVERIFPSEHEFERQYEALGEHSTPQILEDLKAEARSRGLWNMFLPHLRPGDGARYRRDCPGRHAQDHQAT